MPDSGTIQVAPALLRARAETFISEAMTVREISGPLHNALRGAQDATGGMLVAVALEACSQRWNDNLLYCSLGLAETGGLLATAGADYTTTEEANAASFTPGTGGGLAP